MRTHECYEMAAAAAAATAAAASAGVEQSDKGENGRDPSDNRERHADALIVMSIVRSLDTASSSYRL